MPSSGDQSTADKPVTDIGVQRLARVYAQAILDAAGNAGCRNEVLDELRALATEVLPKVPAAAKVFASPRVSVEEKGAMIDKICAGRVLPTTLHSLHVLARHDRLGLLADVVAAAGRLADERDGLKRAEFTTAVPLDAAALVRDGGARRGCRIGARVGGGCTLSRMIVYAWRASCARAWPAYVR
jgi:hypothetical protein